MAEINTTFNKETSHYLLIGVGKRDDDSEAMAVSADDAQVLQRALHAFDLFSGKKFPTLVNEMATRAEILSQLDSLAAQTKGKPADLVIVFFSGHGSMAGSKYYLICRDTKASVVAETAIDGSVFVEKLDQIQCDKMLVLLDCCHAQGITDNSPFTDVPIPFDAAAEKLLVAKKNRVVLAACERGQVSYLSRPVSLFTYALIEGLGGKFLDEDEKEVKIFNLAMGIRERVVALSEKSLNLPKPQRPQLNTIKESATMDFTLAFYPTGGQKVIKVLKEDLTSLKTTDGKKEINTEVSSEADVAYRNEFNWMLMNNTIQDVGDGNYIVQGVNGENVTINNGIAPEQLKDIVNQLTARMVKEFVSILKNKEENDAQQLSNKVIETKTETVLSKLKTDNGFVRQIDNQRKKIIETKIKLRMALLKQEVTASGAESAKLQLLLVENEEELKRYGVAFDEVGIPII